MIPTLWRAKGSPHPWELMCTFSPGEFLVLDELPSLPRPEFVVVGFGFFVVCFLLVFLYSLGYDGPLFVCFVV